MKEENGGGKDRTRDHGTADKFYSIKQKASSDASCYKLVLLFIQDGVAIALCPPVNRPPHWHWTSYVYSCCVAVVRMMLSCCHPHAWPQRCAMWQAHAIRVVIELALWTFHRHCVLRVFSLLPSVGHEKEMLVKVLVYFSKITNEIDVLSSVSKYRTRYLRRAVVFYSAEQKASLIASC